ncbi:hypothetical protein ACTMQQ_28410 [Pseudomonas syringae pv. aptata]|uniref:hypothetical protein n=1 Tax=Pseudomonas syringae TaxID=317 RepID=UPI003F8B2C66
MPVIQDEQELKKAGVSDTEVPREVSKLRVQNNRYFVIILLLIAGHFVQTWVSKVAFDKAQTTKEVVYVKLFPDGNWHVGEFKPEDEQIYFRSTIDRSLESYAKNRYGQLPETVKRNYAEAAVFMSDAMMADFVSTQPGGFNASQRAVDIANNKNSDRVEVTWRFADHYDRIPAIFNKKSGEVIRSNVYLTVVTKTSNGLVKQNGVEKKILRVQWRLLPKEQLAEKKQDWLRVNPLGLEIIESDLIDDPAGYNSAPEGQAQ